MCGIFFKCIKNTNNYSNNIYEHDERVFKFLKHRGPDCNNSIKHSYSDDLITIEMYGSVLWMQGENPEIQPLASDNGCLLFNGDLYNTEWVKNTSDTKALFMKINDTSNRNEVETFKHIISVIRDLNGPFALIYLDRLNKKVYFCRDRIGRRSLLLYKNDDEIILSSVLIRKYKNAFELPSRKIFCFCLETFSINEISWISTLENNIISLNEWYERIINDVKDEETDVGKIELKQSEEDSNILYFLKEVHSKYKFAGDILSNILQYEDVSKVVDSLIQNLSDSVKVRVQTQPGFCHNCIEKQIKCCDHSTIGVLFSGGLDCTILAILAHKHLPIHERIDLLNVAFKRGADFNTPDRITSKQSYEELCRLFPKRNWNLVQIDITMEELYEKQKEEIADLIFPLQTILDDSLGSALWFAARGISSDYKSPCRILLTGIGADELFGGYTRHRNAYKRGGWERLEAELQMDWRRIASRNLARDDRVISHHGRQPRMPYLDEKFVKYVLNLKPWQKCFHEFDAGIGDKMYLRLVAFKLGLVGTCSFPKRAIQFGSKIANKKENAKDISQRLVS